MPCRNLHVVRERVVHNHTSINLSLILGEGLVCLCLSVEERSRLLYSTRDKRHRHMCRRLPLALNVVGTSVRYMRERWEGEVLEAWGRIFRR